MTKTTLNALWLGGGGVLATWLAVTPNQGVPSAATTAAQRPAVTREPSAEDLNAQADRLRERTNAVTLRPSIRNPFRFSASKAPAASRLVSPAASMVTPLVPAAPLPPSLTLSGIAEKNTSGGVRRTAVLSGDGQIYLVGEGDSVAGRYTVVVVEPEGVVLRDAIGAELRLVLP